MKDIFSIFKNAFFRLKQNSKNILDVTFNDNMLYRKRNSKNSIRQKTNNTMKTVKVTKFLFEACRSSIKFLDSASILVP